MPTVKKILLLTIISMVVLTTGCANKNIKQIHPEYSTLSYESKKVALLPTEATMELITLTGENEDMSDKATEQANLVRALIEDKLREKGFDVLNVDYDLLLEESPDLAFKIERVKEAYSAKQYSMIARLNPHLLEASSSNEKDSNLQLESTLSANSALVPTLNHIGEQLGVDGFVLTNYYAFEKSGGLIAKDIAAATVLAVLTGSVAVQATKGHSIEVGIVEATEGEVLWTNLYSAPNLDATQLAGVVDTLPIVLTESAYQIAAAGDQAVGNTQSEGVVPASP